MLNIQMRGDQELMAKIDAAPNTVKRELTTTVTKLVLELENKIKSDKLSGQVLNVVSGDLRASVFAMLPVEDTGTGVVGTVRQSGDVKYGAIHEFGGKTPAHVIVATKAKALAFMWGGKQVFFKSVNHPGSVMPERSFMRSALGEMRDEAIREMTDAVKRGMSFR